MLLSELHHAVVQLSAQRNQQCLIGKMSDALIHLKLASGVEYFEFYDDEGNKSPEITALTLPTFKIRNALDDGTRAISVLEQPQVMKAALRQEHADTGDVDMDSADLALPVIDCNQVVGVILLKDHAVTDDDEACIRFFQEVFNNLISLVGSKERDVLTGLFNRQAFEHRFVNILKSTPEQRNAAAISNTTCLALLDIDHFKLVNDEWGHLIGDEVLLHFSRLLGRSFRYYDLSCRYGGEEFAIALRGVDLVTVLSVLERFRAAVEAYDFPKVGQKTVSIGVSEVRPPELLTSVIERADTALYYAKEHGRNQVQAFEQIENSDDAKLGASSEGDIELF